MTYFLETSRLGFRNWTENDFELAQKIWGNPEVTKLIQSNGPFSDTEIRERLITETSNLKKFGVQYWPFFSLEDGHFIGVCGLKPYKLFDGIFEMGIHTLPEYWHDGIGFEAASAMIEYTFNTLNIKSLFAGHNPQNHTSATLLKKLGFRFTHYEYYPPTGLNHPSYILNMEELVGR